MPQDTIIPPHAGEMTTLVHGFDWARTSLGPMSGWPIHLKCAVDMVLPSRAQIVMFCGPEFVAIYNDAYAPTIGDKHPQALGRPARENWSELWDDLEPLLRRVMDDGETVFAKDRPFYIERHAEPETVYFDISYSPVSDDTGKVLAVLCIVNETTERVRFEAALRGSEARLRAIVNQTTLGILQADLEGRLLFVNGRFCEIVGYSEAELLAMTLHDLVHPADIQKNRELFREMARQGTNFELENRYLRKDGTPVWVSTYVASLGDQAGEVQQAVAVVVDINERKRALEGEQRLAAIVASSEDAVLGIDLELIITNWNAGAEKLYGYTSEEVVGKSVLTLIPDERLDEEVEIITRIKRGERVEPHETVRRHKNGRLVEVSLSVSPIFDLTGRIVGASKIARDISSRKEAERIQNVLTGELNHRVKNVLATVMAIARQTFGQAKDFAAASAAFDARLQSLARAHDLLTHSHWEKAGLRAVVLEVLAPYPADRYEISGPDVDVAPKGVVALSLALHELATNAAKYGAFSAPAGYIKIWWQVTGSPEPRLQLVWQETGGPAVTVPSRRGFGSRLIDGLVTGQLNGQVRLAYDPSGVRCEIEAPVNIEWTAEDGSHAAKWAKLTLGELE